MLLRGLYESLESVKNKTVNIAKEKLLTGKEQSTYVPYILETQRGLVLSIDKNVYNLIVPTISYSKYYIECDSSSRHELLPRSARIDELIYKLNDILKLTKKGRKNKWRFGGLYVSFINLSGEYFLVGVVQDEIVFLFRIVSDLQLPSNFIRDIELQDEALIIGCYLDTYKTFSISLRDYSFV